MLANKSSKLLRAVLGSKLLTVHSAQVPTLVQATLSVKAEHSYDPITNVCLLASITGLRPQLLLVNRKGGVVHPRVMLVSQLLAAFLSTDFPAMLHRAVEKVVAVSYAASSNQLTLTFKATDAMPTAARKLWKVWETEIGLFEVQMTFVTSGADALANESLLRSYRIPVALVL